MSAVSPPISSTGNGDEQPDRLAEPVDAEQPPRLSFPVVGVGASAGGLEAFGEFFKAMPANSGMAFVLIQHLPPERDSMLVEILARGTAMPVVQVEEGLEVQADHVYVIRPGNTLTIRAGKLHLGEPLEKPGHRRPVDDFFGSLAEEQRQRAICIVMSGMGSNGSAGARAVKAVGGVCIAQDPESAKFPSMPQNLIDTGLADFVLRPQDIPEVLVRYATHPYTRGSVSADTTAQRERKALNEVLAVMRARTQHDFTGYRKPTLVRRIQRRMGLTQLTKMDDYARLLRQNPTEVTALADDLMIHVTGFFRDPEAWETLRSRVIVPLIAQRENDSPLRAWVTACSSGEEAYTLAMLLVEAAAGSGKKFDIKIFATDMAERSLAHARSGIYPAGIESEVAPERLERFFEKDDSTYRVRKELRELVVFAPQNVLQDPPFSRLDICTCRNLLIYLEPEIQQRLLALLHFGLREGGALLLGTSETVSSVEGLFEPIDKKHRLFRRIGPTRHGAVDFPIPRGISAPGDADRGEPRAMPRATIAQLANRALMDHYTPPAIVIDRQQHIVYFHGNTERYLDQPRGEPTRELMMLLRESVRGAVRSAVQKAMSNSETASVLDGLTETPEGRHRVKITVAPLEQKPAAYFLVSFSEQLESVPASPADEQSVESHRDLQDDLRRMRDELQGTIEELQTSNEEMKASNEEVTSINEELQSTNEELETSKEELQSLNEELTTVNAQLHAKMDQLEHMTNDLSSLLSSTDIAVIFLDVQFRIRRFTPAVKDLIDLIPSDMGRPLSDLAPKFTDADLPHDVRAVLETLMPLEKEITSEGGRAYIRRALPYRTTDNRIDGVVVTFVDITRRKHAEDALRQSEEQHRLILESIKEYAVVMLDTEGRFATWTPSAQRLLGFTREEAIEKNWSVIFAPADRAAGLPQQKLREARQSGSTAEERWCVRKDESRFWCSGTLSAVTDNESRLRGFVKVLRDNTERRRAEDELRQAKEAAERASEAKDQFLANVSHELRTPLSAMLLWASMLQRPESIGADHLHEGLEAIKRSAEAQKELIEDLLDTSRIAAGKLRLEPREVELAKTVMPAAIEAIRPAAQSRNVNVALELDPAVGLVRVDPHRIQQVVWNLLSNAVKFTPPGGHVHLTMRRDDQEVEIQVSDDGSGISPGFLPHVFDRFGQAAPSTRAKGGLGLGLTISKQLVELHGGTISAASEGTGHGATFTVRLPLPALPSALARNNPLNLTTLQIARTLRGFHVLLVEDSMETRNALVALLQDAGAEVTAVDSVTAAVDAFNARRPDLIISDIGLPDGDGYDLLQKIRALENAGNGFGIPAIALTAHAYERDRRRAGASGFQQWLTKPVEPSRLLSSLAALITAS